MWHVYPSADQPEAYSSVTGSNKATFNPGDVVKVYLAALHVYENSWVSFEPEVDEFIFIGHGIVTNYSYETEFKDLGKNMVHGILLFGKTSQNEFFDYELQHIDVLDISESETHFLDSIIDDNFP